MMVCLTLLLLLGSCVSDWLMTKRVVRVSGRC